jgi:hypothetical protein
LQNRPHRCLEPGSRIGSLSGVTSEEIGAPGQQRTGDASREGITLNLTYEAGLQALEPKNFSGPLWQALTGIDFNVVELPHPDQYSKPIAEHIANSGAYDVLDPDTGKALRGVRQ